MQLDGFTSGSMDMGMPSFSHKKRVPTQLVNVKEHGAAGIGVIGHMHLAVGQVPDQPAVNGAEQQLAPFRLLPGRLHMVRIHLILVPLK